MTRSSISGDARPALIVLKLLFTEDTHFSILSICKAVALAAERSFGQCVSLPETGLLH